MPSPSANVDERRPFTMDRLVTKLKEDSVTSNAKKIAEPKDCNARASKIAPAVALHNQKIVRRMEEEYRRMKLIQERRDKKLRFEHYKRTGQVMKKDKEVDMNNLFHGLKDRAKEYN